MSRREWTKETIIELLQRLSKELGKTPTFAEALGDPVYAHT
jgi:hypothetical protein